jgi:drug/metabolite transporter (DMT)-like permease
MSWFFIALIAPALWAAVNHIDKFVVNKYFTGRGIGSLVIFTGLTGFIISILIFIFNRESINLPFNSALVIAINGALLVASFIPYMYALEKEEASWVSALYQTIPVFGYILGLVFLRENLGLMQIFASIIILIGAVIISLDWSDKIIFKWYPFLLMLLSSFMIAINSLIFKIIALEQSFWGTAFWEYIGGSIFGLGLFLFIKIYRQQFIATIRKNRVAVFSLNISSELLNIAAKLLANFASLLAPLALIWVINGFQPLIVFIYGLVLTVFFPWIGSEKIDKKNILQKLLAMAIIFEGAFLLFNV